MGLSNSRVTGRDAGKKTSRDAENYTPRDAENYTPRDAENYTARDAGTFLFRRPGQSPDYYSVPWRSISKTVTPKQIAERFFLASRPGCNQSPDYYSVPVVRRCTRCTTLYAMYDVVRDARRCTRCTIVYRPMFWSRFGHLSP